MKKSQRARLATLTAKAEASRTPEEKAEFFFLSTLATLHPDAAKDIDDASPAAAVTVPAPAATAPSPAAGANAPPAGIKAAMLGALNSVRGNVALGTDLAVVRADLATRTQELATARTELTTVNALNTTLTAQLGAFCSFFGMKIEDLQGKNPEGVTALLNKRIADEALEQVAAMGQPTAKVPKPSDKGGEKSAADLRAEYASITDPAKRGAFFAKHSEAMYGDGSN